MTTFNFKETNYKMSLKVGFSSNKEIKPIYNSENFEDLKKQSSFFKKFIYDQTSVSGLEKIIKKILNKHQQSLLLANLPEQIDIEFLRVSKLEQFLHSLSWNKTEKPYGNSSQPIF